MIEEYTVCERYSDEYSKLMEDAPFDRDVQEIFTRWRNFPSRTILRIDGARQIGKTSEILKFAYRNYETILYINLAEGKNKLDFESAFIRNMRYQEIMSSFFGEYTDNRNTIIIIDEIQLSSNIYNRLKEFKRQLRCDVIVTGSYLGRIISQDLYNTEKDLPYFTPTGAVHSHTMYSMSFKEFCNALGFGEIFSKQLDELKMSTASSISINYHKDFSILYDLYCMIGGYPSAVKIYRDTQDLELCYYDILQIIEKFKEESLGYYNSDNNKLIFDEIFGVIFDIMMNSFTVKNFSIDLITKEIKNNHKDLVINREEINKALTWVINSGVIGVCHRYNDGGKSITNNAKLYFSDTGILSAIARNKNINTEHFKGVITETFSYNELKFICDESYNSIKIVKESNVYYSTFNEYELDFMLHGSNILNNADKIYGIEVKSGNGSHKSLDKYKKKGFINKSVLVNNTDTITLVGSKNNRVEIPIYFIRYAFYYGDDTTKKEINLSGKPIVHLSNIKALGIF